MNLRVDTDVARGGGKQVQSMNDRLASTLRTAESTLQSAASGAELDLVVADVCRGDD